MKRIFRVAMLEWNNSSWHHSTVRGVNDKHEFGKATLFSLLSPDVIHNRTNIENMTFRHRRCRLRIWARALLARVIAKHVDLAAMEVGKVYAANLIALLDACIVNNSSFEEK
jgi:hypothetical protein